MTPGAESKPKVPKPRRFFGTSPKRNRQQHRRSNWGSVNQDSGFTFIVNGNCSNKALSLGQVPVKYWLLLRTLKHIFIYIRALMASIKTELTEFLNFPRGTSGLFSLCLLGLTNSHWEATGICSFFFFF